MYGPLAGFLLGLAGSLHCAGMCGPIAIALPGNRSGSTGFQIVTKQSLHRLLYQLGRVVTYSLLGVIVGFGGSAFRIAGYSRALSITSGVLMIVAVMLQFALRRDWGPLSLLGTYIQPLQRTIKDLLTRRGALTHFCIGLANGLLPCGLVTTALLGALGSGSVVSSAGYMAAFGFGTVPLMTAIALGSVALPCSWRKRLPLVAPVAGLLVGALITIRGMGLGIPYVSPAPPTVAHSCCTR